MPELPDIVVYCERILACFEGAVLDRLELANPFVLRSVEPPIAALSGKKLLGTSRIGKRIVLHFEEELFAVLHLMIAGRLRLRGPKEKVPKKLELASFAFGERRLVLTEAGTQRRASLHLVRGPAGLQAFDRGGLEVLDASLEAFAAALGRENHTLKRAMSDPRILSGIGNAYSDEILHHARLSPVKLSQKLTPEELARLHASTREVLEAWTARHRAEAEGGFPEKVTAFHEAMAVHGRYGQPCPVCGTKVQRIRYAANETNYCPRCQTEGRLLADRSLSRLLKGDWPKRIEELEER